MWALVLSDTVLRALTGMRLILQTVAWCMAPAPGRSKCEKIKFETVSSSYVWGVETGGDVHRLCNLVLFEYFTMNFKKKKVSLLCIISTRRKTKPSEIRKKSHIINLFSKKLTLKLVSFGQMYWGPFIKQPESSHNCTSNACTQVTGVLVLPDPEGNYGVWPPRPSN